MEVPIAAQMKQFHIDCTPLWSLLSSSRKRYEFLRLRDSVRLIPGNSVYQQDHSVMIDYY